MREQPQQINIYKIAIYLHIVQKAHETLFASKSIYNKSTFRETRVTIKFAKALVEAYTLKHTTDRTELELINTIIFKMCKLWLEMFANYYHYLCLGLRSTILSKAVLNTIIIIVAI